MTDYKFKVEHPSFTIGSPPPATPEQLRYNIVRLKGERDVLLFKLKCMEESVEWRDSPLPEDEQIDAAFPTRSNRHATYAEASRLVSARHSKASLVALVNWLLNINDDLKRELELQGYREQERNW